MTLIQPLLIVLLIAFGLIYVARFRSRLIDRLIVVLIASLGIVMVAAPDLANRIAQSVGVGRGADLITYLGLLGLSFLWLLLYSRMRELQTKVTALARTVALNTVRSPGAAEPEGEPPGVSPDS